MKKIFFLGLLLLVTAFAFTALAAAPEVPADGLQMNRTAKKNAKDPAADIVVFNHSTHKAYKCADCHHPVDGKEDYRSCATAGCHDKLDQKDKSVNSYYAIAHKARDTKFETCVSCHNKEIAAGKTELTKKDLAGCAKSKCHP